MRYIDTGSRKDTEALGKWLEKNLVDDPSVRQLRWQTGFFGKASLEYMSSSMMRLRTFDGVLRVIVGSNDGSTSRADMEALLATAGPPRKRQRIGIVKFANAYFHPKTIHIARQDGSTAAYVGSANLTGNGVNGLNIEAGILLDSREGDAASILDQIKVAIDRWFKGPLAGLSIVAKPQDLDLLVKNGTLPLLPPPPSPAFKAKSGTPGATKLKPLLQPKKKVPPPIVPTPPTTISVAPAEWSKKLSPSDAQRKSSGGQRGSITLVKAGHPINWRTYFRRELFKTANWKSQLTHTGKSLETALVSFKVNVLGTHLGAQNIQVSHAANRESSQANYTTALHLGPLGKHFVKDDMTGKWLQLRRGADGKFSLRILAAKP